VRARSRRDHVIAETVERLDDDIGFGQGYPFGGHRLSREDG
jgi:hypothetical protein